MLGPIREGDKMENVKLSKEEERVLKWLAPYKKPSMKVYMWIIFLATILIWVKHWDIFTQSCLFLIENAVIWMAFNLAIYFNFKYDPVLYDLIQRLSIDTKTSK